MWKNPWTERPVGGTLLGNPQEKRAGSDSGPLRNPCRVPTFLICGKRAPNNFWLLIFPGYAIGGVSVGEPKGKYLSGGSEHRALFTRKQTTLFDGRGNAGRPLGMCGTGMDMFDCVMPTRIARNGTALTRKGRLILKNAQVHRRIFHRWTPIVSCECCRNYTKAYLRHLF